MASVRNFESYKDHSTWRRDY